MPGISDTTTPTQPAVANVGDPTYVEGQVVALSVDLSGNLRAKIASGSVTISSPSEDADTGGGVRNAIPVILVRKAAGGPDFGTSTDPIRTDPTGTTIQPVSGTVAVSDAFLLDATFTGRINTQGQKTMAASTPVVLASDHSSIPTTATDAGAGKTLKKAVVALTTTGDVIAAVATKRLKIYQFGFQSRNDAMTAQFRDGAAGSFMGLRWGFNSREGAVCSGVNPPNFFLQPRREMLCRQLSAEREQWI